MWQLPFFDDADPWCSVNVVNKNSFIENVSSSVLVVMSAQENIHHPNGIDAIKQFTNDVSEYFHGNITENKNAVPCVSLFRFCSFEFWIKCRLFCVSFFMCTKFMYAHKFSWNSSHDKTPATVHRFGCFCFLFFFSSNLFVFTEMIQLKCCYLLNTVAPIIYPVFAVRRSKRLALNYIFIWNEKQQHYNIPYTFIKIQTQFTDVDKKKSTSERKL